MIFWLSSRQIHSYEIRAKVRPLHHQSLQWAITQYRHFDGSVFSVSSLFVIMTHTTPSARESISSFFFRFYTLSTSSPKRVCNMQTMHWTWSLLSAHRSLTPSIVYSHCVTYCQKQSVSPVYFNITTKMLVALSRKWKDIHMNAIKCNVVSLISG